MTEIDDKEWNTVQIKMNLYLIHKMLWEMKQNGHKDVEIWKDLKELFQSADYGLQMELRPIEMIWGDTKEINDILNNITGGTDAKTKDK